MGFARHANCARMMYEADSISLHNINAELRKDMETFVNHNRMLKTQLESLRHKHVEIVLRNHIMRERMADRG